LKSFEFAGGDLVQRRSPDAVAMQGRPQQLNLLYLRANPHGALELLNAFAYIWLLREIRQQGD